MQYQKKINLDDIRYVKLVPVGSADPNRPLSEAGKQAQVDLLNQCLSGNPKGIIIGKDVTAGRYEIGSHLLSMEKVTYHIGFQRKPSWET